MQSIWLCHPNVTVSLSRGPSLFAAISDTIAVTSSQLIEQAADAPLDSDITADVTADRVWWSDTQGAQLVDDEVDTG